MTRLRGWRPEPPRHTRGAGAGDPAPRSDPRFDLGYPRRTRVRSIALTVLRSAFVVSAVAACTRPLPPPPPVPPAAPSPPPLATSAPAPPSLDSTARAFVDDLANHRFDAAVRGFDPEMARALPKDALASLWAKLEEAAGPFRSIDGAETTTEPPVSVVRVTCRFAHLRKVLRVVFGEDGAIVGVFIGPFARDIEDSARALVDKLSRGDFQGASARFDTLMRGSLPPDKLRSVWAQVVKKTGAFAEITGATVASAEGFWAVLLTCRFGSGPLVVKVVYDIKDEVAGLFFLPGDSLAPWKPPAYARETAFTEKDITVGNAPALPGTLTRPLGHGPFPAVVLVHGSGPNDADATLGPNKIFKDLAWGLATRGIAVIRYVKRTRFSPSPVASVKEEVLDGALAAIDLARSNADVDPARVVVVGHSQGGYLAPRIAEESRALAGIVLLAGPSRSLADSLLDQLTYFLELDPRNAENKRLVEAARAFKSKVEDPSLGPDEAVAVPGGGTEKGSYFLSLRGYRPAETAAKLSIPILVLQGDRDYQVVAADLAGYKRALAGKPLARIKRYPALNHLFIAGSGTPRPGEYEVPGHVAEEVVNDIAAFVAKLPPGKGLAGAP